MRRCKLNRAAGATLIECTVALLILSLAMLGLAQLVAASAAQRRLTVARAAALQEVANQAERVAALSWDQTAPEKLTRWETPANLAAAIPDADCRIHVTDEAGPAAQPASRLTARRIHLEVVWSDAAGRQQQPVGLTVWKFQPEETR